MLSFSIPQGFVTGFIGSNGAGKTTMIRLMMDLLEPNTGEIKILGRQMKESAKWIKKIKLVLFTQKCISTNNGI